MTNAVSTFKQRGNVLLKVQPTSFTQHDQIQRGHWGPVPVAPRDLTAGGSIATHRWVRHRSWRKERFICKFWCLSMYLKHNVFLQNQITELLWTNLLQCDVDSLSTSTHVCCYGNKWIQPIAGRGSSDWDWSITNTWECKYRVSHSDSSRCMDKVYGIL